MKYIISKWAELTTHCQKSSWDGISAYQHRIDVTLEVSNLGNLIIWKKEEKMSNKIIIGKLDFNKIRVED